MKRIAIVLILLSGFTGCTFPERYVEWLKPDPTVSLLQESYLVYNLVLTRGQSLQTQMVIEESTDPFFASSPPKDVGDSIYAYPPTFTRRLNIKPETIANFEAENRQEHPLQPVFLGGDSHFFLVNSQDYFKTCPPNQTSYLMPKCFDVEKFKQEFDKSGGIVGVSAIGFDAKGTQALVGTGFIPTGYTGGYTVFFLKKESGQWVIKSQYQVHWIV
jgi:hypothetical protein